MSYHTISNLLT